MINYYTNHRLGRPTQFPDYPDYPSVLLIITKRYTKKTKALTISIIQKLKGIKKNWKYFKQEVTQE